MKNVFSDTFVKARKHFLTPPQVLRAQDLLAERISPGMFPEVEKIIHELGSLDIGPDKKSWVNSLAADLGAKLDNLQRVHGSEHGILYNPSMSAKDYLPRTVYRGVSEELFYQLQMNFDDNNLMEH